MKKLFLILIICVSFLACGCTTKPAKTTVDKIKERGYIIAGVKYDSKPFGYVENGEVKGLDIDIAKAVALNILDNENKIKFVQVTPENRISKLMSEEVDIIVATMTDNEQRRQVVDFSAPYYISGQAVLCKKGLDADPTEKIKRKKTVVVRGTTAEKTLSRIYGKPGKVEICPNYNYAFDIIKNEPDACLIADEGILLGFAGDNGGYVVSNKKLTTEPYAVALRKEDETLKKYINHTINYLESTGELEDLIDKWIK